MSAPGAIVLLLSEDSPKVSPQVLVPLVQCAFEIRVPGVAHARIRFEPAEAQTVRATQGNAWKSEHPKDRHLRVDLFNAIARHVLQDDPPGFVLFHVDADRPWSRLETSENAAKFAGLVVEGVRRAVQTLAPHLSPDAVSRRLLRLRLLMPSYSVEAWLYQNFSQLEAIARQDPRRGAEMQRALLDWRANPHLIEEIDQPKTSIFGANHNVRLAQNDWPAAEVYARGQSYRRSVDGLGACADLDEHLRRLSADAAPSP